jgi:ADP-ribose pyrophosphatase YjhB (NUDIX family)
VATEPLPKGWLPKADYDAIYARVPRLCVEVVIADRRGVLLSLREHEPCAGLWHIPGGTVLFGEPLIDAVRRVAARELGIAVAAGELLGHIEYPSHYENGLDCPVGLAFSAAPAQPLPDRLELASECRWFSRPPHEPIHPEQVAWLTACGLWSS